MVAGRLWLLDTFHPVAVTLERDGRGFGVVNYPLLPSMESDGRPPRGSGSAPPAPAGSFDVLADPGSEAGVYLLTQQIDDEGRQLAARVDGDGGLAAVSRLPPDLRLLFVTGRAPDLYAVALRGNLEVPHVLRLEAGKPEGR